jgi:hypothetical protein
LERLQGLGGQGAPSLSQARHARQVQTSHEGDESVEVPQVAEVLEQRRISHITKQQHVAKTKAYRGDAYDLLQDLGLTRRRSANHLRSNQVADLQEWHEYLGNRFSGKEPDLVEALCQRTDIGSHLEDSRRQYKESNNTLIPRSVATWPTPAI